MGNAPRKWLALYFSRKSLRIEAKEWTAVALCLFSAGATYFEVAGFGLQMTRPLLLCCILWVMIGAWLGDFARLFDAQMLKFHLVRAHVMRISPLTKSTFQLAGVSLAALAIFKVSRLFL
jgi:hypothetical protein